MIDAHAPEADIRALANSNHRRNLAKTAQLDISFTEDPEFTNIAGFKTVYDATMERNAAAIEYTFDLDYYFSLKRELGERVTLFHLYVDAELASSVIVFCTNGIVQYHLGGTAPAFTTTGTARYLLEQVRRWATATGYRYFHLGGGIGARDDSLLRFKAGICQDICPIPRREVDPEPGPVRRSRRRTLATGSIAAPRVLPGVPRMTSMIDASTPYNPSHR